LTLGVKTAKIQNFESSFVVFFLKGENQNFKKIKKLLLDLLDSSTYLLVENYMPQYK